MSRSTPLTRSSAGMIAGVLEGIADHLGWSADRLRVVFVALSILTAGFPGFLIYLGLWFVMPEASEFSGRRTDLRDV